MNYIKPIYFLRLFALLIFAGLLSCGNTKEGESASAGTPQLDQIDRLVLPGDFADPSIIRVGEEYWATATSSQWAPLYPILKSSNLTDWEIVTHVFPDSLPSWADSHFWAPEIKEDNGKFYVYYTARERGASLCIGVAQADHPAGPYKDLGPIVCQEAGAIDAEEFRDEDGTLYLIWKEDGNSRGEPTPLWGQQMNEERTELIGERFELFRNDPDSWEGNLVEGAYLIKKDDHYFTFYSGDACCGRGCTYGIGVARAKSLKGPWEKYAQNPLKKEDDIWKCAGHGSLVETGDGRYFFMYHAYNKEESVYTGRQGLIDEIVWNQEGWPEFVEREDTGASKYQLDLDIEDHFEGSELATTWQWPIANWPETALQDGKLFLSSKPDRLGAVLAQRTLSANFRAQVNLDLESDDQGLERGLAGIGDENNALGISLSGNHIELFKRQGGNQEVIARESVDPQAQQVELGIEVKNGDSYTFSWRHGDQQWNVFEQHTLDGSFLPPWDRAVRIGVFSKGEESVKGSFNSFKVWDQTRSED